MTPVPMTPFPVASLPPLLRDTVNEIALLVQAPEAMIASSVLGAISLVCQDKVMVSRANKFLSPVSLFLMTIAESGEGKTTVDNLITKPIYDHEERCKAVADVDGNRYIACMQVWELKQKEILKAVEKKVKKGESATDLEEALRTHLEEKPPRPRKVRLIYEDATPEAVMFGLHENSPSAGLFSNEAGSIFNGRAMEDLSLFNRLWDGGRHSVDRKTQESFTLQEPRLTISSMMQPSQMQKFMKNRGEEARGNGFLARFLIAAPASRQGYRFIGGQNARIESLQSFYSRMTDLLQQNYSASNASAEGLHVIEFSPAAAERWVMAYNGVEANLQPGGYLSDVRDYAAKACNNVARIAALFHHFEGREGSISIEDMERAIAVGGWYLNEFKRLFASSPEPPAWIKDALMLDDWLRRTCASMGVGAIKKNQIRQYGPGPLRTRERLSTALTQLVRDGRVSVFLNGKTTWVSPCV